jgi:hypothetical protein
MAILLENQAKQLIEESSRTGTAAGSEEWAGVALPLVRRIFAQIAAKDFVSVQPMNLPSGLVFFLDFKYGTAQPGFRADSGKDSQADSVFGVTGKAAEGVDPSGGLYGAGRYGYSINEGRTGVLSQNSASTATNFVTSSVSAADYDFDTEFFNSYSASIAAGQVFKLTVATSSMSSSYDVEAVRAFQVSGSGITEFFPQYTNTNAALTQISFICRGTAPAGVVVDYSIQPTALSRGDFEDRTGTLDIPEINLELRSETIVAKTRKLKAVWTPEFAQDLNAYQNLDAEAELTNIMSEYISLEIDLEILDMLIEDAPASNTEYWSAVNNVALDPTAPTSTAATLGFYNTQGAWFQTLGTKINKISNKIHQLTLRGGANFMVVSPTISTILESIPGFAANANGAEDMEYAFGVQKAGQFNSRYTVYKNPYMTENTILVGFRGKQFLEAGAVFAPYIPLIMTPLIYDPNTFTPRKGLLTRFAKKMLRPEFYGKVYVSGLNTL